MDSGCVSFKVAGTTHMLKLPAQPKDIGVILHAILGTVGSLNEPVHWYFGKTVRVGEKVERRDTFTARRTMIILSSMLNKELPFISAFPGELCIPE